MLISEIENAVLFWGVLTEKAVIILKQLVSKGGVVINPELRPFMFGLGFNRQVLESSKIRYVYATDNMLGILFYQGRIKEAIILYKHKTADEKFVCYGGALYIKLLCRLHNVKCGFYEGFSLDTAGMKDKDAASIGGNKVVKDEDRAYIVCPREEMLEEGV